MRVGLIAPPWLPVPPPEYGGTEEVVDVLARGLVDVGHDVTLFTTGDATCPVRRRSVLDRGAGTTAGSLIELRHVVHAYEALAGTVDIIHDHTVLGPVVGPAWTTTPIVTTNHGPFDAAASDIYSRIGVRVPIIAISRSQCEAAPTVPIAAVILHGVDTRRLRPLAGGGRGGYLAFLGRMSKDKGPHRAIEVAEAASVPLRIGAKMWEPDELRYFDREIRTRLSSRISFVGQIRRAAKTRYLSDALALVNPIRWPEPFGLVMAEALACGTPVLAFAEGAAAEIVDHGITGFLCEDEKEMIARVPEIATLDRRACRAAALARFSAARMVADHVALYEKVLEGTRLRTAS